MAADDQYLFIAKTLEHRLACLDALLLVHIEIAGTVRFGELQRVVQHIAGNEAFFPFDEICTLTWPGVCPGVATSETSSVILKSGSMKSARPELVIGSTESARCVKS